MYLGEADRRQRDKGHVEPVDPGPALDPGIRESTNDEQQDEEARCNQDLASRLTQVNEPRVNTLADRTEKSHRACTRRAGRREVGLCGLPKVKGLRMPGRPRALLKLSAAERLEGCDARIKHGRVRRNDALLSQ